MKVIFLLSVLISPLYSQSEKSDVAVATHISTLVTKEQILELEKPLTEAQQKELHESFLEKLKNQTLTQSIHSHLLKIDHKGQETTYYYQMDVSKSEHHLLFVTIRKLNNNDFDFALAASPLTDREQPTVKQWAGLLVALGVLMFLRFLVIKKRSRVKS
jgi:hypothetical protein